MPDGPSTSAVKKAGSTWRKYVRGEVEDSAVAQEAIEAIQLHRAAHQKPLGHANNGLRSMARTAGCPGEVTQRLKRMNTILDKLVRQPTMSLDKMQDIGGCRIVLGSLDHVYRLRDHIVRIHPEAKQHDYVATPRASGYRGIHLIVKYGPGEPRPIELQLRTAQMHSWAMLVETYSGATGTNYKQDGSSDFQLMASALSKVIAHVESGEPVPEDVFDEYDALRLKVFPQMKE